MIRGLVRATSQARSLAVKASAARIAVAQFSSHAHDIADLKTDEWFLWPREKEGNIYDHNYSLCEDGVVPEGNAYRNARVALLTSHMGTKIHDGKVEVNGPQYFGEFRVAEAGDDMDHEMFSEFFAAQQQLLSCQTPNLFVEDAALGSHFSTRNGVRVTSSDPAVALMFRSLLIPSPPYALDFRARFKGWNFDRRWVSNKPIWNEKTQRYDFPEELPPVAQNGQRPIVAFVGGDNDIAAVQFVEYKNEIVGANCMIGSQVPVRGIIHAIGHAACVLKNVQHPNSVTLPSTVLAQGNKTAVIFGGGDDVLDAAAEAGLLYGAYHNTLSAEGVSAVWGGYIGSAAKAQASQLGSLTAPVVSVGGRAAVHAYPNNLAHPVRNFVFYEKGATKGKLSMEEALTRIVSLSEEAKTEAIKAILQNATVSVIGSPADVKSIF